MTRRQIKMGTATDKYTFIVQKTKEELAEENIDETKKYMKSYKTFNRYFVETEMYKSAKLCLDKYNIVIMSGAPGCGKTNAAIHMLFEAEKENWDLRKFGSWEEFTLLNADKKTVVFIDNVFYGTDNYDLENWWQGFDRIYENYLKQGPQNSQEESMIELRLIITARENVIENACHFMKRITPVFNDTYRKYVNKYPLTDEEKNEIFQKQIEFAEKVKHMRSPPGDCRDFRTNIFKAVGPIGFPLCAHLYACKEEYRRRGAKFFSHPIEFLKIQIEDEVHNDQTSKTKTLFFVLFLYEWHLKTQDPHAKLNLESEVACRQFINAVSTDLINSFSPLDFKDLKRYAQHLSGSFFMAVEGGGFKFVHDSVYEAVGAYFCENFFEKVIPLFPFDVIQAQEYTSLRKDQISKLALRFLYESFNKRFSKIFGCNVFKLKPFSDCFCEELEKKGDKDTKSFFSLQNEGSNVKLPVLFWASLNNHHYLVDKMFCILSKHKINTDFQFYLSLYGECCSKSENIVSRLNGMLFNNMEEIKKRVLEFKDEEKNTVLHLLIMSERSDSTVAEAVVKLSKDKANINARNNLNMSPLMLAVQQKQERTAVVKELVENKAEVKYKDRNGATVFHHCLKSENTDEICAKTLKILLDGKKSQRILNNDDNDGESVLNIAAKQPRYSRLLCILTLLECKDVNVSTLNLDGCSPVYNAVKHLQVQSSLGELECCARLIILILYGVNPEKVADDKTSAKEQCCAQYIHVLKILNNHDTDIMETELDDLIAAVHKKEEMRTANVELPDCSSKLPESIKMRIRQAVYYLASAEL
ncbi:uncharacterized protein LOC133204307 [Saccostrea echinata]|uniref:uncharacterized protein LOC133204307 n=1 Tax=Saccostrea echinata TaxID=191078 RepID=UPI002A834AE0|nr:uncharacterized protein LOC133204307 [Saccostrea echinata]